jgi:Uma2 family endonuclease
MSERLDIPYMTVDEYLKLEESSNGRHEYVDGQLFAMTGATLAHNVICGNLFTKLRTHLRDSVCRAFINDMKVHVQVANSFYYPDVMVTCEPLVAKSVMVASPVLIVEVLSPSTKQIDRREKLSAYRKLASLQEYLIVHQNKMLLELHSKNAEGQWQTAKLSGSGELTFQSLPGSPFQISLNEIYDEVEVPGLVEEEEEEYELAT